MSFGSMNNSDNDSNSNSNDSSGNMKRAFMVEEDRAAVNALTALMARVSAATISGHTPPVTTTFSLPTAAKADQEDKDETKETLEIPQRFTKSGRKRAVSFPLKVRIGFLRCTIYLCVEKPLKLTFCLVIPFLCPTTSAAPEGTLGP